VKVDDEANTSTRDSSTATTENESGFALVTLIEELRKVELDSPLAKLNETTISDNNGGRIEL
jgi:hypothetical protein